jgi:hypothetical protein
MDRTLRVVPLSTTFMLRLLLLSIRNDSRPDTAAELAPDHLLALGAADTAAVQGPTIHLSPVVAMLVCAALAGCGALLPRSESQDISPFESYEAARKALEAVTPYEATLADLKAKGFDVSRSANVQQVPYPQWVGLLVHPSSPLDGIDRGIRDCISAEQACHALLFRFGRVERERRGGFVADFLNFHRVTRTYGWRFEGVVLLRHGVVLFRNHGGQPNIEMVEDRWNPLGPLQGMGESVPQGLMP